MRRSTAIKIVSGTIGLIVIGYAFSIVLELITVVFMWQIENIAAWIREHDARWWIMPFMYSAVFAYVIAAIWLSIAWGIRIGLALFNVSDVPPAAPTAPTAPTAKPLTDYERLGLIDPNKTGM